MKRRLLLISVLLTLCLLPLRAQFYLPGDDPGSLKWSQIRTRNYRIMYPRGMDSLARAYVVSLESVRADVGATAGFLPNQNYRKPMPVLMHPYSVYSNGSVAWAPRMMQLVPTPDAAGTLAMPWMDQLVLHEARHDAQMQFCNWRGFKVPSIIFGQLWAGAMAAVYPGPAFFEGDAVAAETELSFSGRGRDGDFLEYWRVSFAAGQRRDWWRWRYGSNRLYTPDYYRAGYVLIAGARDVFDCPDFTDRYFKRIFQKGLPFWNLQKTVREASGGLKFKDACNVIFDSLDVRWARERVERGPFVSAHAVSPSQPRYTAYEGLAFVPDYGLFSIRSGIASPRVLVRTDTAGKEHFVRNFSPHSSGLRAGAGGLVWSECVPDLRWGMRSYSDVFALGPDGKTTRLTRHGRYFNPSPSPDGKRICVTEFPPEGGSAVVVLASADGAVLERLPAPSGLQFMEAFWLRTELYVTAIDGRGWGIYRLDGGLSEVLPPTFHSISRPFTHNGNIYFRSDRSGVGELYRLAPDGGLLRVTSTEFGAADFQFAGDSLYFTQPRTTGRPVFVCCTDSLKETPVHPLAGFEDPLGDKLTLQHPYVTRLDTIEVSNPKPYHKAANLMRFHSWAPAYVNIDAIDKLSMADIYQVAGLGVTTFFQNDLGTMSGTAAVHINAGNIERSGGYARFSYSGLYPVLEATVDGNNRDAYEYVRDSVRMSGHGNIQGTFRAYVPLNLSSGGWRRGIVPQLKFAVSNDVISPDGVDEVCRMRLDASVRGYVMQYTPSSCLYPRWGVGAEVGYSQLLGVNDPGALNAYGYLYAYLPGFWCTHGFKLTAYGSRTRASASLDYAIPFGTLDWSGMCPVAYLRNFELVPHVEYNWYYGSVLGGLDAVSSSLNPLSWGADLIVRFSNLLWIPYDTRIGVRARNTGVSFIFGIDI